MVEMERKTVSVQLDQHEDIKVKSFSFFGIQATLPVINRKLWYLLFGILIFVVLLMIPSFKDQEQRNCMAILVFVSYLWALEVLPLFVTAILVPLLVIVFRVLREPIMNNENVIKDYRRLNSKEAAKKIFSDMFSSVIMLLLGGFALAAALSKHQIAKSLAGAVLSKAGDKPVWIILTNMLVSTFASMWISNVAAPVLCFSLVFPILRNLPSKSNYAKALVFSFILKFVGNGDRHGCKCGRYGISYIFSPKYNCNGKYESRAFMGRMVLNCDTDLHNFGLGHMGTANFCL